MPSYRLIFPVAEGIPGWSAETALVDSDEPYEVGAKIEHGGRLWQVTKAPLEEPSPGEIQDLMVWPAE